MSDFKWWSLVFRAFMRWVIVGGWFEWLVIVVDEFSISYSRSFSGVVLWCFIWEGLVGGGGGVVICLV